MGGCAQPEREDHRMPPKTVISNVFNILVTMIISCPRTSHRSVEPLTFAVGHDMLNLIIFQYYHSKQTLNQIY